MQKLTCGYGGYDLRIWRIVFADMEMYCVDIEESICVIVVVDMSVLLGLMDMEKVNLLMYRILCC
jgi:hypothetical protein